VQPADGANNDDIIRSPRPVSAASALTPPSSSFGSHAPHRQSHLVDALPPSAAARKRKQQHDPPPHGPPHVQQQQPNPHQPNPKQKRRSSMAHLGGGGGGQDTGGGGGGGGASTHPGRKPSSTTTSSTASSNDGGGRGGRGLSIRDAVARTCLDSLLEAADVRTCGLRIEKEREGRKEGGGMRRKRGH
jgi:hypothetical protein